MMHFVLRLRLWVSVAVLLVSFRFADAQTSTPEGNLDPTRDVAAEPQHHDPLPEEYLWTAGDITAQRPDHNKYPWNRQDLRIDSHCFRTTFGVTKRPQSATVYVAGVRSAKVWINGELVASFTSDIDAPIGFHVFHADVARALHAGENTLAIEAVRGRGVVAGAGSLATQQLTYGEAMVAKIVPATYGSDEKPLVISTAKWKSSATAASGWETPGFNDSSWANAASLGPVESNVDFFQWSADAGMYEWPGYLGMSPTLRTLELKPQAITHIYEGSAKFEDVNALTKETGDPFAIRNFETTTDSESPGMLVDFGREIAGRLLVRSSSSCQVTLSVAYGESDIEAMATGLSPGQRGGNYLGTNLLHVPFNGIARGPKSAFRYARIRILKGCPSMTLTAIHAEAIYYPVTYKGSFESSDAVLNRIWETGAYTAHLSMQDGIWDAPKRDRGRWAGDLDVEGKTILTAFGDTWLLEDTLDRLAASTPDGSFVNGIPGYSAQWIAGLATLYLHSGDRELLTKQQEHLRHILATMDGAVEPNGRLKHTTRGWGFVDWAPGLYGSGPDVEMGTALEFARAYKLASEMLKDLGDSNTAAKYASQAAKMVSAAAEVGYGSTLQVNSMAVLTAPDAASAQAIATKALVEIRQEAPNDPQISPYFNAYLLDALARAGREKQAQDWMRTYWGGMLAEGATSFWESYDLRWPKPNFHLSLEADGTSGYFVSLAHGWSSGPTAWLAEQVLGVEPTSPGYASVAIHPRLSGLEWAKGTVPTPHGIIAVSMSKKELQITLPHDVKTAAVTLTEPVTGRVLLNGKPVQPGNPLSLKGPGNYTILWP